MLLVAFVAALLVSAAPAQASFHEILVREVYAGGSNSSYVVLQAYSSGQNLVGGHAVVAYGPNAGAQLGTFTFPGSVSNNANQMTILVADSGYAAAFPSGPSPDGTFSDMNLDPAGGAVCWDGTPDCVSWGNFSGSTSSPAGTPAVAMSGGQALRRKITGGCATLLEPGTGGDDHNNSSEDFELVAPIPRNNASAITETQCTAPNTTITSASVAAGAKSQSQEIEFMFSATPSAGAEFECKLDTGAFGLCTSPKSYSSLDGDDSAAGTSHTFQVRAKNANGTDSSPATHSWTVDIVDPTSNITNQPQDPSPGGSAAFSFSANETSTFKCTLEGPKALRRGRLHVAGKTYLTLPNGDLHLQSPRHRSGGQSGPLRHLHLGS